MKPFLGALATLLITTTSYAQTRLDLDATLQQAVGETLIPGLVAMVTDDTAILYSGAFGQQDVAARIPMQLDTIFRIASMTKPVTSVAVMMLVEQGDVALDDPIARYIPALGGKQVIDEFNPEDGSYSTRPAATAITIRHLLTHTSGLGYGFASKTLAAMTKGSQEASAQDYPLLHDPGALWTYGESTRVLGQLVTTISGQPLDSFMRQRIFVPLGMNDTSYRVPPEQMHRVATVHRLVDGELVETPNPASIDPDRSDGDGGLNSTAGDYIKFIQMLLRGGLAPDGRRLLSAETVRSMGQNHTGDVLVRLQDAAMPAVARQFPLGAGRDSFGLGFQVTGPHEEPGVRAPGSMSWAGIFNTEFWVDPASGIGAVLLMQYLPFYDADAIGTLVDFEQRIYEQLK